MVYPSTGSRPRKGDEHPAYTPVRVMAHFICDAAADDDDDDVTYFVAASSSRSAVCVSVCVPGRYLSNETISDLDIWRDTFYAHCGRRFDFNVIV